MIHIRTYIIVFFLRGWGGQTYIVYYYSFSYEVVPD